MDQERVRLTREEDLYKQEMLRLEKDLSELESTVEELRGNVINRKTRVNMSDVENMALILSKSSKTVADLKLRWVASCGPRPATSKWFPVGSQVCRTA